jgi:thiosulfate/3-mercaptopyruvate sulfurtransferase
VEPHELAAFGERKNAALNGAESMFFRWMVLALASAAFLPAQTPDSGAPPLRSQMLVTTTWLAAHLHDPELVVLCVSAAPEFCDKGRIPGARKISLGEIAVPRDGVPNELPPVEKLRQVFAQAGVSNSSRIVLYGERFNLLAARAYFTLDYLGVADHAALLDGGLEKWTAERRPLSTELPQVKAARLEVSPRPEILLDTAGLKALTLENRKVALIDARPAKEYSGEQLSEDVGKAGHIPGATSLYWMDMLVSRENPVLRPADELRRMYQEAHAVPGQKLVTYCRTGMQSSFDYFVAKYLGYDPGMYDASFYEWSRKDLPVEK